MIKHISITNFQSHERTDIELSPRDTVIVGLNDSGKSAIIRALEWMRTNRPLGTSFVRKGQKNCEGKVVVSNDDEQCSLLRRRDKGVNEYWVDDQRFEAMASAVPELVTERLNLGDINVQHQLQPYFMVLDSPGQVAKVINAAIGIEESDKLIADLMRTEKEAKSEGKRLQQQIESLEKQQAAPIFGRLDEFAGLIDRWTALKEKLDETSQQLKVLNECCEKIEGDDKQLAQVETQLSVLEPVRELDELYQEVRKQRSECTEKHDAISKIVREIESIDDETGRIVRSLGERRSEWKTLLEELTSCPVCEQGLDELSKEKAIGNLLKG